MYEVWKGSEGGIVFKQGEAEVWSIQPEKMAAAGTVTTFD